MKNTRTKLSLVMLGLTLTAQPSFAEDAGNFYLNPAVGYQFFDSERKLEEEAIFGIGAEYVLAPNFGLEVGYLYSNPDLENASGDVDLDQFSLDALFYTEGYQEWQPFLLAGIGHGEFDFSSGKEKETQLNLGIGTRIIFNDMWSARIQAKAVNSLDEEVWDQLFTIGISYAFGGGLTFSNISPKLAVADSDGDGINNDLDQCPDTLAGMLIDEKGCDLDSDNDGIADNRDYCSNSLAGTEVDAKGCELDSDDDGIADNKDYCPNSLPGSEVDTKGCKVPVMKAESVKLAINFANNSADVPSEAMNEIKNVADFMASYPQAKVVIEGYTDNRGDANYNKSLSQRRADAVMQTLVQSYNIGKGRVSAVGYGIENPVADNNTLEGRRENRRVIAQINLTVEE